MANEDKKVETSDKVCFVMMPFDSPADYDSDHFDVVYKKLFEPAIKEAGYISKRSDDNEGTYCIRTEILNQILQADVVLCDLTTRNPNVMFELGLRQAFDKPVVLIQENGAGFNIFDISNFKIIGYDRSLRVDKVEKSIEEVSAAIKATVKDHKGTGKVNSIVKELSIASAVIPDTKYDEKEMLKMIYEEQRYINRKILSFERPKSDHIHEFSRSEMCNLMYKKYLGIFKHRESNSEKSIEEIREEFFGDLAFPIDVKRMVWERLYSELMNDIPSL